MAEAHERLDDAMNRRRLELDMTWAELADRVRVDEKTLRAIRAGRNRPSERTARRLEDALHWPHGTVAAIIAGVAPPADEPPPDVLERLRERLRDEQASSTSPHLVIELEEAIQVLDLALRRGRRILGYDDGQQND